MLKYLAFFLACGVGVPLGTWALNRFPRMHAYMSAILLFLTVKTVDINFISREFYRGTSKGFEVSFIDLLLLSMLFYLLIYRRAEIYRRPPGTVLYVLYVLGSLLSFGSAADPLYSAFEILKMLRMYLLFWVIYQWFRSAKDFQVMYYSIGAAMMYIFTIMLKQKYLEGMWQAKGPFPHQNSLVMYANLFNCLLFAYVLHHPHKKKGLLMVSFAFWCAGMLCTVFTFSRGGLLFLGAGLGIVLLFSLQPKQINARKIGVLLLAGIAAMGIGIKAADSIQERFETAPEESMEVRAVLAIAALNMVKDKPLGVGLNQFGLKINPPYPYGDHIPRQKVSDPYAEEEKGGLVETIYLMIAAECGWHTLAVYLLFVWSFVFRAARMYFRVRHPFVKMWALGLGAGLTSILCNSCFEWVLKQSNNYYQIMMVFALILALERMSCQKMLTKARGLA
jgi:hypothetical protein